MDAERLQNSQHLRADGLIGAHASWVRTFYDRMVTAQKAGESRLPVSRRSSGDGASLARPTIRAALGWARRHVHARGKPAPSSASSPVGKDDNGVVGACREGLNPLFGDLMRRLRKRQ